MQAVQATAAGVLRGLQATLAGAGGAAGRAVPAPPLAPPKQQQGAALHFSNLRRHSVQELAEPGVNVVHLTRPASQLPAADELRATVAANPGFRAQVTLPAPPAALLPAAEALVSELDAPSSVAQFLVADVCDLAQQYAALCTLSGPDAMHAKLEVVGSTPCPKWHADHVRARLLCTYTGAGTLFMPDSHVARGSDAGHPLVSVRPHDEQHAQQAGPGDVLLLKGHEWEANLGLGAVHRSPSLSGCGCGGEEHAGEQARLVLTLDEARYDLD